MAWLLAPGKLGCRARDAARMHDGGVLEDRRGRAAAVVRLAAGALTDAGVRRLLSRDARRRRLPAPSLYEA